MKTLGDESGQTIILAALCMTILLGFLALAVDVGLMFHTKREVQTAADSGAIAGAEEINYGDITSAARADAAENGVTNGTGGATVTVNNPPLDGPHTGNSSYVEVIASQSQSTYFMSVFNRRSMTVSARAVATMGSTDNCVYALETSGTGISVTGGANVQSPGCAFYADSNSSTALAASGGATLNAQEAYLVGGYSDTGGAQLTPTSPTTGIAPVSDPLAFLPVPSFSTSSCLANPNLGGGGKFTLDPSSSGGTICYNGLTISGGATATLNPGFYIINGALTVGGGATISGTGVTFYLPVGASVSFSNGMTFNLTAPTSGIYDGILFYQNRSNSTAVSITGGSNSSLQGILYFPDANVTLSGGSSTSIYASVVSGSLSFSGGATLTNNNYAIVNKSSPLASARLVE